MRTLALSLIASCVLAVSALAGPAAPPSIDRATYPQWLTAIGAPASPYFDYAFRWAEAQQKAPLPAQVAADPDKLFVTVAGPLDEARKAESSGDVEEGTTYGLETYGIVDAPIATVLETILYRWGKPVGQPGGVTHPNDLVYGYREEKLSAEWGPGSFHCFTTKTNGGIANDQHDSFALLLRGDDANGYVLAGSFLAATGDTSTTSSITIILIKPTPDGKTDYRVAGMQTGQNYAFFGVERGRSNFGFNAGRIRDGQKDFYAMVNSLKSTGMIPEKKQ